ncbi:hypothetical protein L198_02869 [Cryptococcus wingfieldii CBS 7118]|uniref:Uncharacterized protein n=1 Tax=Cryptococcus wingfieldii CBS 7118 TaxID=1295528 RepID=A0A1E3JI46_9TREE|nr:hypothetical protein L198_02869 [Cryptococcus wingfieldii CBS 7118]ODO00550.1 hypothetical protein L198_02869 [Cryptococcus wingfieldii CBS 7118]
MASQITTQIWSGNNGGYVENVYPLNGILERDGDEYFAANDALEGLNAFIWTRNTIDHETGDIYRNSFTTSAHASTNGNAENRDYMEIAWRERIKSRDISRIPSGALNRNESSPASSLEENEMEHVAGMLIVGVDSDQVMSDASFSSAQDGDEADD